MGEEWIKMDFEKKWQLIQTSLPQKQTIERAGCVSIINGTLIIVIIDKNQQFKKYTNSRSIFYMVEYIGQRHKVDRHSTFWSIAYLSDTIMWLR